MGVETIMVTLTLMSTRILLIVPKPSDDSSSSGGNAKYVETRKSARIDIAVSTTVVLHGR